MKIIFCLSNLFVPASISLIKESNKGSVILYTDQQGIYKLFKDINFTNVIIYYRDEPFLWEGYLRIGKYLKNRRKILTDLNAYNIKEVFFFHNTFGDIENWIIRKLSSGIQVFYIPIFNKQTFRTKYSLKTLKKIFNNLIINRVLLIPHWTGERYVFEMSKTFFKGIKAKPYNLNIQNQYINSLISKIYNLKNISIVLLTGSMVELGQVEKSEYINKINILINSIRKENIIAKPHPRFPNKFANENLLESIPSHIPINLLFSKFKIYIGYSTAVLSEAADNNLISISLLDYFSPVSETRRINYKNYLLANSKTKSILFPKNINEIIKIINENKI